MSCWKELGHSYSIPQHDMPLPSVCLCVCFLVWGGASICGSEPFNIPGLWAHCLPYCKMHSSGRMKSWFQISLVTWGLALIGGLGPGLGVRTFNLAIAELQSPSHQTKSEAPPRDKSQGLAESWAESGIYDSGRNGWRDRVPDKWGFLNGLPNVSPKPSRIQLRKSTP